ncbi:MAG TPA: NAD(P)H-dependent oxidoreductase, partial [Xanthomonadales bacterium]|nr:NAD(P)H-dependent oxidoreductase [Xanthomonadales bacterium]
TAAEDRSPEQAAAAAESDALIEELRQADVVVIGLPMYNFGIPSTLKSWIDHVARVGHTFKYTETGPVGLLQDRPVYLFAARGGLYHGTPRDTQSAYMTHFLNFIGIRNIEFVYAEGLAMGEQPRLDALTRATDVIDRLAA